MLVASTIVITLLSAWFYRLGGIGKSNKPTANILWRWAPDWMFDTKARDIGCSLAGTGWMALNVGFSFGSTWQVVLAYVVCFGGTFGALTTYWDSIFGHDNFFAHGFMIALAKICFAIFGGISWLGFGIGVAACSVGMGVWCLVFGNDYVEECGRGAIKQLAKLPFALIK